MCMSCESVLTSSGRPLATGSGSRMRSRDRATRRDVYRGDSADVSRLLDSLLHGYDKRLRPNYSGKTRPGKKPIGFKEKFRRF